MAGPIGLFLYGTLAYVIYLAVNDVKTRIDNLLEVKGISPKLSAHAGDLIDLTTYHTTLRHRSETTTSYQYTIPRDDSEKSYVSLINRLRWQSQVNNKNKPVSSIQRFVTPQVIRNVDDMSRHVPYKLGGF